MCGSMICWLQPAAGMRAHRARATPIKVERRVRRRMTVKLLLSVVTPTTTTPLRKPASRLVASWCPPCYCLPVGRPTSVAHSRQSNPELKDRVALNIIADAERQGLLRPGGTIVEATSGNTGMGLAMVAAVRGYQCIFVMPDKMSQEKIASLRAFGARVVTCPTAVEPDDPRSYYSVSRRIVAETPDAFYANQYHNPANPEAHYVSTAPEIWDQTGGEIDVFCAGLGTGGTISGCARYFKERKRSLKAVGVDPIGSLYYDYIKTGRLTKPLAYDREATGEDFLPPTIHLP